MKHLRNKDLFQGGGRDKPKPKPAVLRPPELGKYEILSSYSVAEIVDLISDGPIEGLVNQNGARLGKDESILQGVYLDNTPIEITSPVNEPDEVNDLFSLDVTAKLNLFGDIFYDNDDRQAELHQHRPPFSKKKFTTKVSEANLIMSRLRKESSYSYYSPLSKGSFKDSTPDASAAWTWVNDKTDDGGYFKNKNGALFTEVHYKNKNLGGEKKEDTAFLAGTILATLDSEIQNHLNSNKDEAYRKVIVKAQEKSNELKEKLNNPFDFDDKNQILLVVKIAPKSNSESFQFSSDASKNAYKIDQNNDKKLDNAYWMVTGIGKRFSQNNFFPILVPKVNSSGVYTGEVYGAIAFILTSSSVNMVSKAKMSNDQPKYEYIRQIVSLAEIFANDNIKLVFAKGTPAKYANKNARYNYLDVACEFRAGHEFQQPLQYFKNIYVDYEYGTQLVGPSRVKGNVQRITKDWDDKGPANPVTNIGFSKTDLDKEGSVDARINQDSAAHTRDFSQWNKSFTLEQDAVPVTHTIENPNVTHVFFTLSVNALADTQHLSQNKREAGQKIPAVVNFEVEWGKTFPNGKKQCDTKKFSILALIESQTLIDFGCPEYEKNEDKNYSSIKAIEKGDLEKSRLRTPFKLPPLNSNEHPSSVKRYIKVTKISTETQSVLIDKSISLAKVTEIISNNLSYPLSSLIGIKIDARSFGSIPERSYDCRLKRVQVPSNYFPLEDEGMDKRYISSAFNYNKLPALQKNHVYIGDWNGDFKTAWTDNPAWIIFDLLTSKRYGLGAYLDASQINKWELYKIARFCDAVDDEGYFLGVSDGVGGLEPRYSCNIVFREQTKIFDAINIVASLFRGVVFFSNSEIHFLDDRPRIPVAMFNNSNVKDGIFNYGNNRRDQQFNTVEVAYLDRFDNYQTKIEYIEDEQDIRKRGVFKTTVNTLGVTSRAMARRMGQHLIYQTIKENQSVEFVAGMESLLCRPGDLVIIEDDLRTNADNYGRVLQINTAEKSFVIEGTFDASTFTDNITVYTPTGYKTIEETKEIAMADRSRMPYFDVTKNLIDGGDSILTGRYSFSGYLTGYAEDNPQGRPTEFPYYTGKNSAGNPIFCYYNTGATGFVFAVTQPFSNNNSFDKVITNTGIHGIEEIRSKSKTSLDELDAVGFRYSSAAANKRSTSAVISGDVYFSGNAYKGILESEISTVNNPQITTFDLRSYVDLPYGTKVFLDTNDPNINLINFVAEGSPYRIQRKNATDQIYKISSIREQNQNEYTVAATKYDTGKFAQIENSIAQDFLPDTYATGNAKIDKIEIISLPAPTITHFKTGVAGGQTFDLSGRWVDVANAVSYDVEIFNEYGGVYETGQVNGSTNFFIATGQTVLGEWTLRVKANGNKSNILDSKTSSTGYFAAYQQINTLQRAAVSKITLL